MLVAHDQSLNRILASLAVRGEDYTCPDCSSPVIVKRSKIISAHYAHALGAEACPGSGETEAHMEMKLRIYHALKRRAWVRSCDLEVRLHDLDVDRHRRVDVWAETDSGVIAIECQVSPLTVEEVEWKVANYTARNIFCLYVVHRSVFGAYIGKEGAVITAGVPMWVQSLHDVLYGGRVYVYDRQSNEASRIVPWHLPKQWGGRHYLKRQRWVKQQLPVNGALALLCERIQHKNEGKVIEYARARFQDPVTWKEDISEDERQREYMTAAQRRQMFRDCLHTAKYVLLPEWIKEGRFSVQQRLTQAQELKKAYEQAESEREFPDFVLRRERRAYFEAAATVRAIEEHLKK